MDEFDLIENYFKPLASQGSPSFELLDDVSMWTPPEGHSIVLSKDVMVSGIHFFENENPELVARKLLRVNLSDLAASGAIPKGYLLGFMVNERINHDWLKGFVRGLKVEQDNFGLTLFGGDTVKTPNDLCLSLTIIGHQKNGERLGREKAIVGDDIFVTGTIGDASLGLKCIEGELPMDDTLVERLRCPEPRLKIGQALLRRGANAAVDVSDGLLADLGHILKASNVGAQIEKNKTPLSDPALKIVKDSEKYWTTILTSGDDYELIFTSPKQMVDEISVMEKEFGVRITKIGTIIEEKTLQLFDVNGQAEQIIGIGYNHFDNQKT